jgi:D-alanyl-D-alanine carboxypeptidase
MPILRALFAAPLLLAPPGLGTVPLPSEPHLTPAATYLPRPAAEGRVPTAALPTRRSATAPYDTYRSTGPGIRRADRFRAGSVTKPFVATVVLQLARERRLHLTDTVERLLPGLVRGNGNDGRRITLRTLLSHSSGLYDYTGDPSVHPLSPVAAVRVALAHRPANAPGRYAYSNTDCAVLGLVVQRVTGQRGHRTRLRHRDPQPHHHAPPPQGHLPPGLAYLPARPAQPRLHPRSGRRGPCATSPRWTPALRARPAS